MGLLSVSLVTEVYNRLLQVMNHKLVRPDAVNIVLEVEVRQAMLSAFNFLWRA